MRRLKLLFALAMILGLSTTYIQPASAAVIGFNAGRIIDDIVMANSSAMSVSQIQSFLNSKVTTCDTKGQQLSEFGGPDLNGDGKVQRWEWGKSKYNQTTFTCLKNYSTGGRSAAQIIYDTGRKYSINPQVLIVLLQKEQSLVTDTWPVNTQYKTATGYGCPDTAPCDSKYYGLVNQLDWAAHLFHSVMTQDPGWYSPYVVGNNFIRWNPNTKCGGSTVKIENWATAALYDYTPYRPNQAALNAGWGTGDSCSSYGNRNFYSYFTQWFGSTRTVPSNIWLQNGNYRIESASNKAVDVSGAGTVNGTNVDIWTKNDSGAQIWTFTRQGDGFYTIQNPRSGKYLDVAGGGTSNGTNVDIWTGNTTCAQKWAVISSGNSYSLLSACSGKALDVEGGTSANGTNVRIWTRSYSSIAQRFNIQSLAPQLVTNGVYRLTTPGSKSLDVAGGSSRDGTDVRIWSSNTTGAQDWLVFRQPDGLYKLKNPYSGKYLDVSGGGTSDGTNVQIWSSNSACAQKWTIVQNTTKYSLLSACSGKALDVAGGSTADGTDVRIWAPNTTDAQKWSFVSFGSSSIADGTYRLVTAAGKSIDIVGAGISDGTNVQIWTNNNSGAQTWLVARQVDGFYTLKNPHSGKFLDVAGGGIANTTNVRIWSGNPTCAQKWAAIPNGSGYSLLSACSGKALDVNNGGTTNGTNVQIWTKNMSSAQRYTLTSL